MNFERKTCTGVPETQVFQFADIFFVRVNPPPQFPNKVFKQGCIQVGGGANNYMRDTF